MKPLLAAFVLLLLAACADLPPGRVPFQSTAERGGGDAYFNFYPNIGQ